MSNITIKKYDPKIDSVPSNVVENKEYYDKYPKKESREEYKNNKLKTYGLSIGGNADGGLGHYYRDGKAIGRVYPDYVEFQKRNSAVPEKQFDYTQSYGKSNPDTTAIFNKFVEYGQGLHKIYQETKPNFDGLIKSAQGLEDLHKAGFTIAPLK